MNPVPVSMSLGFIQVEAINNSESESDDEYDHDYWLPKEIVHSELIVQFDGAARNNPRGPSACAFCIWTGTERILVAHGNKYLGKRISSNETEYQGLIMALKYLVKYNVKFRSDFVIQGDSELVINQLKGI